MIAYSYLYYLIDGAGGFVTIAVAATVVRALITAGQPAHSIPWRTLGLNVAGAFVLGWFVSSGRQEVLVTAAALGSLTTFSTVAAEAAAMAEHSRRRAVDYVGLTVIAGVAAAWLGLEIGAPL